MLMLEKTSTECIPKCVSAPREEEPAEPARTVGWLKQVDNRFDLPLDRGEVGDCHKGVEYLLRGCLRRQMVVLPDVFESSLHALEASSKHHRVIEEPLDTLPQMIDILPMMVPHALVRFPVALLMKDVGDLLKLVAYSSAPTQLHEQEGGANSEKHIWLVYPSRNRGQLPLDRLLVELQATVPTREGLNLRPDMPQRFGVDMADYLDDGCDRYQQTCSCFGPR